MPDQYITYVTENKITTVTIANPPANALSAQVMAELNKALDELAVNGEARVIIITGSGKFFSAGADIKEISALASSPQTDKLAKFSANGQQLLNKIQYYEKPVIAAINGFCLGGGLELAMACHIRIASEQAKLGQPEINLAIIPGFGGTQRLPRIVGRAKAIQMILTGDMITANEALSIGLVDCVSPETELTKVATTIGEKIATKSLPALSLALKAINEGLERSLSDGLMLESNLFSKILETEDAREGISAFLEKRQPKFKDK
ncbi:MAG TPA: enoyl-CoA hydratase [Candidatus Brocadiales bacterium]|nr:enoyl-CoA hydratase [Candidatus Brocadiales bacterium]